MMIRHRQRMGKRCTFRLHLVYRLLERFMLHVMSVYVEGISMILEKSRVILTPYLTGR